MTVYWILLFIAILLLLSRNFNIYRNKSQRYIIIFLIATLLGMIYIFRSDTVGTDYKMYKFFFLTTTNNFIEHGYVILNHVAQHFNSFLIIPIFVYFISFFGLVLLGDQLKINKFSLISFYIITGLYIATFNLIRESIAVGFVCFGLYLLLKFDKYFVRKYILFITFILLATEFHKTAIFCILFIFLSKIRYSTKTVLISGVLTTFFAFTNIIRNLGNKLFIIIPSYGLKYQNATGIESGGVSFIKFLPIICLFILLYIFLLKAKISNNNINIRFILAGFLIYLLMFSADGNVAIGRLQTYTTMFPILFLCLIMNRNIISTRYSWIRILFSTLYILLYSVQLLHGNQGIVPYSFI